MSTQKFYPGDTVTIGRGRTRYDVSSDPFQGLVPEGQIDVWSHNTGKHSNADIARLRLVSRGAQGKAADDAAQREAEQIAQHEAAARREVSAHAMRRSGTNRKYYLAEPRPAFGQ